jgi:hypothetical protein
VISVRANRFFLPFPVLPLAFAVSACGRSPEIKANDTKPVNTVGNERLAPEYDQAGKLTKLSYDRDGDGKPDTWGYMDGSRVVRVEVDENGDGKVDRWEYHKEGADAPAGSPGTPPAPGAGPDKSIERIERATHHDGKVNRKEFFENGALTRVEEDADGNGAVDKWETYANGALTMMALDTQGRGRPDRRLVYKADGSFDHIEADPSGSGTFRPLAP